MSETQIKLRNNFIKTVMRIFKDNNKQLCIFNFKTLNARKIANTMLKIVSELKKNDNLLYFFDKNKNNQVIFHFYNRPELDFLIMYKDEYRVFGYYNTINCSIMANSILETIKTKEIPTKCGLCYENVKSIAGCPRCLFPLCAECSNKNDRIFKKCPGCRLKF